MKEKIKRVNFTVPTPLFERVRKEAFVKKTSKSEIIRRALELYFIQKQ